MPSNSTVRPKIFYFFMISRLIVHKQDNCYSNKRQLDFNYTRCMQFQFWLQGYHKIPADLVLVWLQGCQTYTNFRSSDRVKFVLNRTSELQKNSVVLDHIKTKHNRTIPENEIQKGHFPNDTSTMLLIKLATIRSQFTGREKVNLSFMVHISYCI